MIDSTVKFALEYVAMVGVGFPIILALYLGIKEIIEDNNLD
jgi:hypothetical protein